MKSQKLESESKVTGDLGMPTLTRHLHSHDLVGAPLFDSGQFHGSSETIKLSGTARQQLQHSTKGASPETRLLLFSHADPKQQTPCGKASNAIRMYRQKTHMNFGPFLY